VHSGVTTFIEVKVHPNTTTDLQVLTLTQLAARGAPAYLITYHKQTKVFDVVTIAAGTQTTFKNVKDLSVWLVEHNCLNINARPLN
jgi:hypothetical protein